MPLQNPDRMLANMDFWLVKYEREIMKEIASVREELERRAAERRQARP